MSWPNAPQRVLLTWTIPNTSKRGELYIDATTNEEHGAKAQVSEHQTESGLPATDNIRPLPRPLTLEGFVTNTPIEQPKSYTQGEQGTIQSVQIPTIDNRQMDASVFKFDVPIERVREVFGDLVDAVSAGSLFNVTTTLANYENMGVENFTVPRNAALGNALKFSLTFKQLRIVSTETVAALPARVQKKHRGAKTGKPLDPKKDEKKTTVLDKLLFK